MKRPSLLREIIDFIEAKMAVGQSRHEWKNLIRRASPGKWTVSTGRIHSYSTKDTYLKVLLHFGRWARDNHGIRHLDQLTANPAVGVDYLTRRVAAGMSPYTVQKDRAALNLLYWPNRHFDHVLIPIRTRKGITRSRGPAKRDSDFCAENYADLIDFTIATGLRRCELERCLVKDVIVGRDGQVWVRVPRGKGGRRRVVRVLRQDREFLLSLIEGRPQKERLFDSIPSHLNTHALRREAAQRLYMILSERPLPPVDGRLRPEDYDKNAVKLVSQMLGHNRRDVVLRSYIR
ncbi:MAG: site-specific integrase [Ignavibacteriales bacterium]